MITKTILLPVDKAAIIQQRHAEFECHLIELGLASQQRAKVTVLGPDEKMVQLFELIGETVHENKESKKD